MSMVKKNLLFCIALLISGTFIGTECSSSTNCSQRYCASGSSSSYCGTDSCGKTILTPRSLVEDSALANALTFYRKYDNYYLCDDTAKHSASFFNATPLYYRSTKGSKLATLFAPDCQECFTIKEDGTGNVGSVWLNAVDPVNANYSSVMSIAPQRAVLGALFQWNQDLSCLWRGLWFQARFAVAQVKNNLHAREKVLSQEGTIPGAATALQYLSSANFNAGRFACGTYSKGLADDLQLQLGKNVFYGDHSHLDIYLSVLAPTSKQENPTYLFQQALGRGRHAGIGGGLNAGWKFWESQDNSLTILADFTYEYLFKHREYRSFDLTDNGVWSRYLQAAPLANTTATTPLINFLTQPAQVTPKGRINFWTGLHHEHKRFQSEIGYNFWWKQQEGLCLDSCAKIANGIGIADITGYASNTGYFTTASTATISQSVVLPNQAVSDAVFTPITLRDLNLNSARQNRAITNKIYAAAGYDMSYCGERSLLLGGGASYEFACKNNAIAQWGVWGNITLTY